MQSLVQFSVDGRGCFPSLLFDLRPNYGGDNEDNGNFLQKVPCTHCCTQCPQPCSRQPPTHASARDSWTLNGKSGSVSFQVNAPFSWVLVCTRFYFLRKLYLKVFRETIAWLKIRTIQVWSCEVIKNPWNILNAVVCWSSQKRAAEDLQLSAGNRCRKKVQKRTHKKVLSAGQKWCSGTNHLRSEWRTFSKSSGR